MKKLPKIILNKKPTYLKIAEGLDLFGVFSKIESEFKNCFILESLGEQNSLSRYSIVGFDPQHIISAKGQTLYFDDQKFEFENPLDRRSQGRSPYSALREIVPQDAITKFYAGGLIGYMNYESVNYFEPSLNLEEHPLFDTFKFGVYLDGLVFDKVTGELFYFYYEKNRLDLVKKLIKSGPRVGRGTTRVSFLGDTLDREGHKKNVEYVLEQIKAGNTFQCEVGFKSEFKITGDCLLIYENLRKVNPSPFMYYLKFGDQKMEIWKLFLWPELPNGEKPKLKIWKWHENF